MRNVWVHFWLQILVSRIWMQFVALRSFSQENNLRNRRPKQKSPFALDFTSLGKTVSIKMRFVFFFLSFYISVFSFFFCLLLRLCPWNSQTVSLFCLYAPFWKCGSELRWKNVTLPGLVVGGGELSPRLQQRPALSLNFLSIFMWRLQPLSFVTPGINFIPVPTVLSPSDRFSPRFLYKQWLPPLLPSRIKIMPIR